MIYNARRQRSPLSSVCRLLSASRCCLYHTSFVRRYCRSALRAAIACPSPVRPPVIHPPSPIPLRARAANGVLARARATANAATPFCGYYMFKIVPRANMSAALLAKSACRALRRSPLLSVHAGRCCRASRRSPSANAANAARTAEEAAKSADAHQAL